MQITARRTNPARTPVRPFRPTSALPLFQVIPSQLLRISLDRAGGRRRAKLVIGTTLVGTGARAPRGGAVRLWPATLILPRHLAMVGENLRVRGRSLSASLLQIFDGGFGDPCPGPPIIRKVGRLVAGVGGRRVPADWLTQADICYTSGSTVNPVFRGEVNSIAIWTETEK